MFPRLLHFTSSVVVTISPRALVAALYQQTNTVAAYFIIRFRSSGSEWQAAVPPRQDSMARRFDTVTVTGVAIPTPAFIGAKFTE